VTAAAADPLADAVALAPALPPLTVSQYHLV